jgi:8-oxo-dGTP diphosphatase
MPGVLAPYDRLRIELADRMLVVAVDGRVDEECADQITYALCVGCPVEFLGPAVRMRLDLDLYDAVNRGRKTVEVRLADAKRADLGPGALISFTRRESAETFLLCRVTLVESFGHRAGLLATVDPSAVLPGSDRSGLAARLEQIYPEAVGLEHLAIHLQCLGEADPAREREMAANRDRTPARQHAGVLIVNENAEVLLVQASGQLDWQLPGRTVADAEEGLSQPIDHAPAQDLGAGEITPGQVLVVDQVPTSQGSALELVLFGGTLAHQHADAVSVHGGREIAHRAFVPIDQAHTLLTPRLVRRVTCAYQRLTDDRAPMVLSHGYAPGAGPVWSWHEEPFLPEGVPVRQAGVFAFDPDDGRVLLQHRVTEHRYGLPAGRPEPGEEGDPLATAIREAYEESQIVIGEATMIGFQYTEGDPAYPGGLIQIRYAAPIVRYDPITPDQDAEHTTPRQPYRRYLCDVQQAGDLLDFGTTGYAQAAAAARAARALGLPVDRPAPAGYRDHAHTPVRARPWIATTDAP